jgi:hypothetical protein
MKGRWVAKSAYHTILISVGSRTQKYLFTCHGISEFEKRPIVSQPAVSYPCPAQPVLRHPFICVEERNVHCGRDTWVVSLVTLASPRTLDQVGQESIIMNWILGLSVHRNPNTCNVGAPRGSKRNEWLTDDLRERFAYAQLWAD